MFSPNLRCDYPKTGGDTIQSHYMDAQEHGCDGLAITYNKVDVLIPCYQLCWMSIEQLVSLNMYIQTWGDHSNTWNTSRQ